MPKSELDEPWHSTLMKLAQERNNLTEQVRILQEDRGELLLSIENLKRAVRTLREKINDLTERKDIDPQD